jgi:hypothetical protein
LLWLVTSFSRPRLLNKESNEKYKNTRLLSKLKEASSVITFLLYVILEYDSQENEKESDTVVIGYVYIFFSIQNDIWLYKMFQIIDNCLVVYLFFKCILEFFSFVYQQKDNVYKANIPIVRLLMIQYLIVSIVYLTFIKANIDSNVLKCIHFSH